MQKKKKDKHAKKEAEAKGKGKEKKRQPIDAQIKELEDQISKTKYNKKTQRAIGMYKAKLAKLKEKKTSRGGKGGAGKGYSVRKSGDATVILLGFPSVGKSTLLNGLTDADSPVGSYDFTTLDVIPGMMKHKHAKIQILDVPGIVKGAASGRGRGKEVLAVIRNADLILIMVDIFHPNQLGVILKEVYDVDVRLNQRKPDVKIKKSAKGGIRVGSTMKLTWLNEETVKAVCKEMGLVNADVLIRDDINVDQFIDVIEGNKAYIPSIIVVNKIDMAYGNVIDDTRIKLRPDLMISAEKELYIDKLKDIIFDKLLFMRLYLKEVGKKPDMEEPLIMFKGCTIKDVCTKLHRDFLDKFRFARIWGKSVRFAGMKVVKTKHVLKDKDILELHMK